MKFPKLPHPSWPGAREVRERMLKEQRQQSAPSMRRRTVGDDDAVYTGNCGRPVDAECGLIDPITCVTHGPALVADDDDRADEARSLRRQVAQLRKQAMRGQTRSARQRIARLETLLGPG